MFLLKKSPDLSYQDIMDYVGETTHLGGSKTTKAILKHLVFKNKKPVVLDAGCGTGKTLNILSKEIDCQLFGLDKNRRFISKAKGSVSQLIVGDLTGLPFKDEVFDAVLCEDVLPFVDDVEKCIKEFTRVLKNKGFLAITTSIYFDKPDEQTKEKLSKLYGMKLNLIVFQDFMKLLKRYNVHQVEVVKPDINIIDGLKALHPWSWIKLFSLFLNRNLSRRLFSFLTSWLRMIKTTERNPGYVAVIGKKE